MRKTVFTLLLVAAVPACIAQGSNENTNDIVPIEKITFRSSDHAIILTEDALKINGASFQLLDCSSVEYYCIGNEDIGFFFYSPKKCQTSLWDPDPETNLMIQGVVPHSDTMIYANTNSNYFRYAYSKRNGLSSIITASEGMNYNIDDDVAKQTIYHSVGQTKIFNCL